MKGRSEPCSCLGEELSKWREGRYKRPGAEMGMVCSRSREEMGVSEGRASGQEAERHGAKYITWSAMVGVWIFS